MARYVLEGEWSGYSSSQRRVVHRETINERRRARYEGRAGLFAVRFTDGTLLELRVRPVRRGEKVETLLGYGSLICEAEASTATCFQVRPITSDEEVA
ncbi:hypothetical protein [Methylobacterium sp. D48H]|jgi:hypothetical protein